MEFFKYFEDKNTELKRQLNSDVKKEIVAFLNTNGGIIYVGVNDDGTLYTPFLNYDKDEILLKISSWIYEAFFPLPSALVSFNFNDDGVLKIVINEGVKKPYYLREKGPRPGGVYKRSGTSTRKCNDDEILKMIMESSHYVYEVDISVEQELTFRYFEQVCEEKQIEVNTKLFIGLNLMRPKGQFTNLGLLISDQSPIAVKIAEYDDEMNFKLKKTIKGSLLKALIETQEQTERLNDITAIIDTKSWKRIETTSYPRNSLREIILNAFCHTDFFIRSNIKIEFYKDKVKITSPGGLYKTTLDDVLKGVQT